MYNRRIICDIDDTISRTLNRDWENAEPILPVINKLNRLYDSGWEIWLVTSRGQLSCGGDSSKADQKYRGIIEKWLQEHGVKYHMLSFEKKLATYYVDDKSLTPTQFVDLEIKKLSGGWSGADVELRDGRVYKTNKDSLAAADWYRQASFLCNTPKIYSVIGDTLCMEYIEKDSEPNIQELVLTIADFSAIRIDSDFNNYVTRIKNHVTYNKEHFGVDFSFVLKELNNLSLIEGMNEHASFCHGDLSLDNVIRRGGKNYLIDPIFEDSSCNYSSFLLDVSKLMYSLRKRGLMHLHKYVLGSFCYAVESEKTIPILELTQWLRVYKYAPEAERPIIEKTMKEIVDHELI